MILCPTACSVPQREYPHELVQQCTLCVCECVWVCGCVGVGVGVCVGFNRFCACGVRVCSSVKSWVCNVGTYGAVNPCQGCESSHAHTHVHTRTHTHAHTQTHTL